MSAPFKRRRLWLASALALSFAVSAQATDRNAATTNAPAKSNAASTAPAGLRASAGDVRASKLIGKEITNPQGENLGKVSDLVVDTSNGKVQYTIVSFGGFLGLGDKLFAYPLERFRPGDDKLVLDADKEKLKSAPGFDAKRWPDFNTAGYRAEVDKFHGARSASNVRFARASEMLKGDVKDRTGNDVGDIEDIVVDLRNGNVHFVVLKFDRAWTHDDKLVAMPMKALRSEDRDGTDLVYVAGNSELQGAPSFDKDRWPDFADSRFRADVDRYSQQTWINNPQAQTYPPAKQAIEGGEGTTRGAAAPSTSRSDARTSPTRQ